jgi:hypothetical protein
MRSDLGQSLRLSQSQGAGAREATDGAIGDTGVECRNSHGTTPMTMDRPTKILACGALIAGVIAGFDVIGAAQHSRNVETLRHVRDDAVARCVAEGKAEKKPSADKFLSAESPWEVTRVEMLCNPQTLIDLGGESIGVQKDLVSAQQNLDREESDGEPAPWPYLLAAMIFGLSLVPWAWYFLLRRIRELAAAIRG